jgi:enamine deaminase RidA (YjgF/YER057c/UK114 family)
MTVVEMKKEILDPESLAPARGFNHGIVVEGGKTLYLAGQDGANADEEIVAPDDLVAQFRQVLSNLETVVTEAGGEMNDIVKLNIFVADRDDYVAKLDPLGEVFSSFFDEYPTMALFEVSAFFKEEALIELEGVAVIEE